MMSEKEFLKIREEMWKCIEKQLREAGYCEEAIEFRRGLWTGLTYGWLMVREIQRKTDEFLKRCFEK